MATTRFNDAPYYFGKNNDEEKKNTEKPQLPSDSVIDDLISSGGEWEDDEDVNDTADDANTNNDSEPVYDDSVLNDMLGSGNIEHNEDEHSDYESEKNDKESDPKHDEADFNNSITNELNSEGAAKEEEPPKDDVPPAKPSSMSIEKIKLSDIKEKARTADISGTLLDIKAPEPQNNDGENKVCELAIGIVVVSNNWTQTISSESIKEKFEKTLNLLSEAITDRDVSFKSKDTTYIFNNRSTILFVDTASSDGTWESIVNISNTENSVFSGIRLTKDPGYENAVTAGISWLAEQKLDYCLVLDINAFIDGIDSINKLLSGLVVGNDIVYGQGMLKNESSNSKKSGKESNKKKTNKMAKIEPSRNVSVFACSGRIANMLTYINPYNTGLYEYMSQLGYSYQFSDIQCDIVPDRKKAWKLEIELKQFASTGILCAAFYFILPSAIPALILWCMMCSIILQCKHFDKSDETVKILKQVPEYAIDKITAKRNGKPM